MPETIDDLIGFSYPSTDVIINGKSQDENNIKEDQSLTANKKVIESDQDLNSNYHDDIGNSKHNDNSDNESNSNSDINNYDDIINSSQLKSKINHQDFIYCLT